jgi:HEAT repeat protein
MFVLRRVRRWVKIGDPAVPHLIQALGDGIDVRAAACRALGAIGDGQAVPPLIQALGDGDVVAHVREAACEALVKIGDPKLCPPSSKPWGMGMACS